jgi:Domain of unknown function (DUF5076)
MSELLPPDGVSTDKDREIVRVWFARAGAAAVSIDTCMNNPEVNGRLILDLAIAIARDYVATGQYTGTAEEAFTRILALMRAELDSERDISAVFSE